MISPNHGHLSKVTIAGLIVTLGIIYGDIGTSPLYVMSAIIGKSVINADIVKGDDTIRVINLHLQSLRFSKANLEYIEKPSVEDENAAIKESKNIISKFKKGFLRRQIQADRIRAEINKSPYPVIVTGDFNDVPNSYAYHTIGGTMKNAFAEKGTGLGRTFSGISPVLRIDNIFVAETMQVQQFLLIKKKLSDHFPIIADVQMGKK